MKKELLADKRKIVRKEMEFKKIEEDDTLERYNADTAEKKEEKEIMKALKNADCMRSRICS